MSDEIRTPKGRRFVKCDRVADAALFVIPGEDGFVFTKYDGRDKAEAVGTDGNVALGTVAECLAHLDARADETVAALLPPGSMVVTEDRVVELASILVKRVAGDHVSGLARVGAVNALIADLRAGAQS